MQKVSRIKDVEIQQSTDTNPLITSRVVNTLADLMDKITAGEISPETVNAACNCAEKMTDIFKFHLDFEKFKAKSEILKNR